MLRTSWQRIILARDARSEFSCELYDEMGRINLIGIRCPVEMGGQGGEDLSCIVSLEENSKVDASRDIIYSVSPSLFSVGEISITLATNEDGQLLQEKTPDF